MSSEPKAPDQGSGPAREQFPALSEMLRALNNARRQCSMYGGDHPNAISALGQFTGRIDALVAEIGSATCVFTRSALIVNDAQYQTGDTGDLYQRLKVRGVLSLTFLLGPSEQQALGFLGLLNTDPREVRDAGGASQFLRKHGCSRIVATEQVYELEDENTAEEIEPVPVEIDRVLALALKWLLRQDEETDDESAPVLPIADILEDPEATAKLIREAVTKLHRSRNPRPDSRELSNEVLSELKDLSGLDHEGWDRATPQVRKAIAKLPPDMRPSSGGFVTQPRTEAEKALLNACREADVAEVEAMVRGAMMRPAASADLQEELGDLQDYFAARPTGIISSWQSELDPGMLTASSASTLSTLIAWEQSPTDHARQATALAGLLRGSVEAGELQAACASAEPLLSEASGDDPDSWRVINARMALGGIDVSILKTVVLYALDNNPALAAAMVEVSPAVAVEMAPLLGVVGGDLFTQSLQTGLADSGSAGATCLGNLLRTGTPTQAQLALGILVQLRDSHALIEITSALRGRDEYTVVRALTVLPGFAFPDVEQAVVALLNHRSVEVRCAALTALGRMGDEAVLSRLWSAARFRPLCGPRLAEQLTAIRAIGLVGGEESRRMLSVLAEQRSLLRRKRAELVRDAASAAMQSMPNPAFRASPGVTKEAAA